MTGYHVIYVSLGELQERAAVGIIELGYVYYHPKFPRLKMLYPGVSQEDLDEIEVALQDLKDTLLDINDQPAYERVVEFIYPDRLIISPVLYTRAGVNTLCKRMFHANECVKV